MNILLIILIVVFLVVLYIYSFVRIKKRRSKKVNTVSEYRSNYVDNEKRTGNKIENNLTNKNAVKVNTGKKKLETDYNFYITKYNSHIDYVDKDTENKQ